MPTLSEIARFREDSVIYKESIPRVKLDKRFVISIVKRVYKKKERIAILVYDKLNFRYTEAIHTSNEERALSRYESTLNYYKRNNCIVIDKIELIKEDDKYGNNEE